MPLFNQRSYWNPMPIITISLKLVGQEKEVVDQSIDVLY
jgi:hypothetical protein